MGGSADPETPTPSPPSAEVKRLKRCVQSKLSWGPVKPCGCGDGGAAGFTAAAEEGAEKEKAVAEKGTKRGSGDGKLRKSEAGKKSPSNKETTGLDPSSKDEVILVEGSPQKKQRKGGSQAVALKVPNRKRCKAMGSVDGHGSCQQLHNSQTEAVVPEASPVSIDIDLMSIHSESRQVNGKAGVLEDQGQCEFLFDPRSEAKIAEEENLKLLSGKKIHPFFTSRVVNKGAGRDVINIDDRHSFCAFDRDLPYCPIHVSYQSEADVPIDWSKWVINKGSFLDTDTSDPLESAFSLFEGLVKPLTIETHCKRKHLDQLAEVNFTEHATAGMDLQIFSKEQSESKFSLDVIHVDDENMLASNSSCCVSLDNKHQEMVVNGRPEIFQKGCQPGCYLWTDKYRPETASQVCGNCEHVNFLNDWLKAWDERGRKNKHIGIANGNRNGSLCHDESDVDYSDDASDYENVLLITGPVGCGKSAAVFACAKEQGFNVIEVNTSDMRNGAYVRQKFEEATKSHGLEKWSQEEVMSPPREDLLVLSLGTSDSTDNKHSPSCSTRIAISCDQHKSPAKDYLGSKGSHELPKLAINKTLILFEDVDTVFDEDRGFISTILKLAETTKWPIILTSNKKDPALPRLLDQLVLDFKYPSSAELLSHVEMICKTEGADITVPIMKHIIYTCSGDIRKTIMLLQFWCQGGREYTDRLNKCSSGPFSVDLEAVHSAVPKMLPWEFQCQLSETVCKEIDQTIFLAEQNRRQMNALRLEDLKSQVMISSLTKGRSTTKTRKTKKSKLKRGHSTNCKEISPCDNDLDDFNDAPDVPVPSDLQRIRNRHGAVLSSESDDDPTGDCTPKDTRFTSPESGIFPTSSGMPDLNELETLSCFPVPNESRDTFGIVNSFENPSGSNMAESPSRICDTFMSQDVSYVPESAFIVESISVSNADFLSLAISNDLSLFCDDRIHAPFTTVENTSNMENVMTVRHKYMEDVVGETCEVDVESFCRNEQASCSTTGYQLMDECSRAESIWLLSGKQSKDSCKSECVQDTWDRLRSHRLELLRGTNHQRTSSGALKLASGISDLISESDILFTRCNPLTVDILDPSSTPCVEPDEFSWYDRQLEMGSVYARHALCFYSKNCQDMGENSVDIAHELLSASSTATSLGKVLNLSIDVNDGSRNSLHVRRERQSHVYEILLPIIPAKLSLSLSGPAFIDYLSSTSQISRLEYSRISESKAINMQRRSRESRHYLSSGALSLSPEDVELLAESSCFNNRT